MDLSEISKLESPKVGTLRLSEAIRVGAKIRPQCTGTSFDGVGSCVIGAAYEAITGKTTPNYGKAWIELSIRGVWPDGLLPYELHFLNDRGKTREQIADILEARGL